MLIRSVENEDQTTIALPKGDWWEKNLKKMIGLAGLSLELRGRSLVGTIPELSILFVLARAMDIPMLLTLVGSEAVFGVTGSDCQKEFELRDESGQNCEIIEQVLRQPSSILPLANQPALTLYATPNSNARNQREMLRSKGRIVTTFPNITQQFLGQNGASKNLQVLTVGGGSEGLYALTRRVVTKGRENKNQIVAAVDVRDSGDTGDDNGLRKLGTLMEIKLIGLRKKSVSSVANQRVNDFVEALASAKQIEQ